MEKVLAQSSAVSARGGKETPGSEGALLVAPSIWDFKTGHWSKA